MITPVLANIHLYGNKARANELVGAAKQLVRLLSAQTSIATQYLPCPDGSYIYAQRIEGQYSVTIWGKSSKDPVPTMTLVGGGAVVLQHGVVTSPSIIDIATPKDKKPVYALEEFTGSKQMGKKRTVRKPNPLLARTVKATLEDRFGPVLGYAQAGVIAPTMYSGVMRNAVQMMMAAGSQGGDYFSIEYDFSYYQTHGVLLGEGTPYLCQISEAGVFVRGFPTAPLSPAKRYGFDSFIPFSGMPLGGAIPGIEKWDMVLSAEDMAVVYADGKPPIDAAMGWVFNDEGSQAMIVSAYGDDDYMETELFSLLFTYDKQRREWSAELSSEGRSEIASPGPWWKVSEYNGYAAYRKQIAMETDSYWESGGTLQSLLYLTPDWLTFDIQDDFIDSFAKWVPGGYFSNSWLSSYRLPILKYTRLAGPFAALSYVNVPSRPASATPGEIDAIIHVSCIENVFHIMSYYWWLEPTALTANAIPPGGGRNGLEPDAHRVYSPGLSRYSYSVAAGVPPTIYTSEVDKRRASFMACGVQTAGYSTLSAQFCPSKPEMCTTPIQLSNNKWADLRNHTELHLPFMCREGYILRCYDAPGDGVAAKGDPLKTGEVTGFSTVKVRTLAQDGLDLYSKTRTTIRLRLDVVITDPALVEHPPEREIWTEYVLHQSSATEDLLLKLDSAHFPNINSCPVPFTTPEWGYGVMPLTLEAYLINAEGTPVTVCVFPKGFGDFGYVPSGLRIGGTVITGREIRNFETPTPTYVGETLYTKYFPDMWPGVNDAPVIRSEPFDPDDEWIFLQEHFSDIPISVRSQTTESDGYVPITQVGFGSFCRLFKDKSELYVFAPGLPDYGLYKPSKCHQILLDKMVAFDLEGPDMGYATLGEYSVFFDKHFKEDFAGFGAIPAGLTLKHGDVVCYVGQVKNG